MTTPKKPGPEPRAAQNRSAFSARRTTHVTVGGHHLDRLDRLRRPAPAPAVPAHPALQQEAAEPDRRAVPAGEEPAPAGEERVEVDAAAHRRPDGHGLRWPRRSSCRRSAARSMSSVSSRSDQAAQLCPPERTATCRPSARASRTPAATSAASAACSTAAGRRDGRRWLKIRLTAASRTPRRRGRSSCPVNRQRSSAWPRGIGGGRRDQLDQVAVGVGDVGHPHPRFRRVARVPDGHRATARSPGRRLASRSVTWKHTWLRPWTRWPTAGRSWALPALRPPAPAVPRRCSPSPSANAPRSPIGATSNRNPGRSPSAAQYHVSERSRSGTLIPAWCSLIKVLNFRSTLTVIVCRLR